MDWGNCFIRTVTKDAAGEITALTGELNLGGSVKTTKYKLTWLPQIAVRKP
jgi:glutamyl-tRNA synthetase